MIQHFAIWHMIKIYLTLIWEISAIIDKIPLSVVAPRPYLKKEIIDSTIDNSLDVTVMKMIKSRTFLHHFYCCISQYLLLIILNIIVIKYWNGRVIMSTRHVSAEINSVRRSRMTCKIVCFSLNFSQPINWSVSDQAESTV